VIAYVDGKWTPADEARISVLDHGLLYGDGVFEGIRVYGGTPFLLDEHLERLAASARAIVLELPAERAEIAALCREAAARAGLDDGYLRLVVTRGAGALGVSPHTCPRASLIVIAAPNCSSTIAPTSTSWPCAISWTSTFGPFAPARFAIKPTP
jgi:branched-chain amino acid aminotransferase